MKTQRKQLKEEDPLPRNTRCVEQSVVLHFGEILFLHSIVTTAHLHHLPVLQTFVSVVQCFLGDAACMALVPQTDSEPFVITPCPQPLLGD